MIKIEKDIPPPVNGTTIANALMQLSVNDSFFLSDFTSSLKNTLHIQIRRHRELTGATFMTRVQDEDGGVRVWRLT
jgi:hypothetical protein